MSTNVKPSLPDLFSQISSKLDGMSPPTRINNLLRLSQPNSTTLGEIVAWYFIQDTNNGLYHTMKVILAGHDTREINDVLNFLEQENPEKAKEFREFLGI